MILALVLAGSAACTHASEAVDDNAVQACPEDRRAYVGFYVLDVWAIDMKDRTFEADLYFWLRFDKGHAIERDANRLREETERFKTRGLEFVNGELDSVEVSEDRTQDPEPYITWRAKGKFRWRPNLRRYPFDHQSLAIDLEHSSLDSSKICLVDDTAAYQAGAIGVEPDLEIPEFRIAGVQRRTVEHVYPTSFGDPTAVKAGMRYSRYELRIQLERRIESYLVKILIPLLTLLATVYLVFFLGPKELVVAAATCVTLLLAAIAFQLSLAGNLPEVGYVVTADKIFHLSYVLIMLAMIQSVVTYNLDASGRGQLADRLEIAARWLYPIIFVAGVVFLAVWPD